MMWLIRSPDLRKVVRVGFAALFSLLLLLWLLLSPGRTDGPDGPHRRVLAKFDPEELDTSDPATQRELCRQHGWTPFKRAGGRKVYDLIMINTELDWLEIRLNTTYDYVDHFVIVESRKTFTNRDKPLVIRDNMDRFAAYRDKIVYHELDIPDGFHSNRANPAWAWEDLQRDAMYRQVFPKLTGSQTPVYGDVIIVADVDELLRPEALVVLKECNYPRRLTLRSDMYYYSYQFLHKGKQWAHPQATYYQGWRTIYPVNLRNADGAPPPLVRLEAGELWSSGWHCSTCFATVAEVLNKMSSFSHIWLNQEAYRDPDRIADHVRAGRDLWDRPGEEYERIDGNRDVPPLLLLEQQQAGPDARFAHLLSRDGPSAGFADYPSQ